jgi:colicin import membrane protein
MSIPAPHSVVGHSPRPLSDSIYRVTPDLRAASTTAFWNTIRAPKFVTRQGFNVEQAQLELQLKVWKELAISKQVLMRSATDALKLDPNCTQDELKQALDAALKKVAEADSSVVIAREQAKQAVSEMEKKLTLSVQAHTAAEATIVELRTTQENITKQASADRVAFAKEVQALKDRVAEKDKAIKAINTALADTPENVIKKMKTLKKEKQDEADARRQVEGTFNNLRKEKQELEQQLAEVKDKSTKLATQYRDTHALSVTLHEKLKPLIADAKELPALPELDEKLLEDGKPADANGKSKSKK